MLSSYLTFHVFRHLCLQANGSTMKAGGNSTHFSLALSASKIPAFIPSSTRAPNANVSRPTNQTSSSFKSSIPCLSLSWPSSRPVLPSNDSIQSPRPPRLTKGQTLTLPSQTQNCPVSSYTYSSSSSSYSSSTSVSPTSTSSSSSPSSPSLLSPTTMCRGGRAVHMPTNISSHRSLKASSGQATTTPASFTGDMA
ncbi:uncharacterized protein LOC127648884 [Xyrauchen texanus]|uniref:uncharacterized protein LOC127648884 n=1 Tax=Xyrauchen texanus TaxID=154827 RepID=UPI002242B59B|nr:uncharacterized protein LOC127648884 [Xyrauchen texanus]